MRDRLFIPRSTIKGNVEEVMTTPNPRSRQRNGLPVFPTRLVRSLLFRRRHPSHTRIAWGQHPPSHQQLFWDRSTEPPEPSRLCPRVRPPTLVEWERVGRMAAGRRISRQPSQPNRKPNLLRPLVTWRSCLP